MKLIPEWRQAWRMRSIQLTALLGALPLVWMSLEPEEKDLILSWIPEEYRGLVLTGFAIWLAYARLKDQGIRR